MYFDPYPFTEVDVIVWCHGWQLSALAPNSSFVSDKALDHIYFYVEIFTNV